MRARQAKKWFTPLVTQKGIHRYERAVHRLFHPWPQTHWKWMPTWFIRSNCFKCGSQSCFPVDFDDPSLGRQCSKCLGIPGVNAPRPSRRALKDWHEQHLEIMLPLPYEGPA